MQTESKPNVLGGAIQLAIAALIVIGALNYQQILDQYALATFHPAPDVAAIEGRLSLTTPARAKFYRAQPQIDDKVIFNHDCETQPNQLELGCFYHGRIYVMKIDNQSLAAEMDVVTAHELLHAEWNNLSASDRRTLGDELERVHAQVADDGLRKRMAGYAQSEPGEEANELHSILGTEYTNLSPTLEQHYAKIFANRSQIVAEHQTYQSVLNDRYNELELQVADIRTRKGQLGVLNRQLESYRTAGQIDTYNSLVPKQNRLVDQINTEIAAYNLGKDEYNALVKSLDSREITDTEATAQ